MCFWDVNLGVRVVAYMTSSRGFWVLDLGMSYIRTWGHFFFFSLMLGPESMEGSVDVDTEYAEP